MAFTVHMPALGESVTEGTVTRWLKHEGDAVAVDEPLLEVSTDKVDTEIPSPAAGVLTKILINEDRIVAVGGDLALIGELEPTVPAPTTNDQPRPAEPEPLCTSEQPSGSATGDHVDDTDQVAPVGGNWARSPPQRGNPSRLQHLSPKCRSRHLTPKWHPRPRHSWRRARRHRPRQLRQPDDRCPIGRPRRLRPPHLSGARPPKASRIRRLTAIKTRESLLGTAQLTQTHEVDMTAVVALRARAKTAFADREGVNLTFLPFIATAAIEALKAPPNVNASYDEVSKEITYHDAEHLGLAVDTERGLLSPVIHRAGDLSLAGLARAIVDVAGRARSGAVTADELTGGTFTITNIGSEGALFDTPILVPPQAAILATGVIRKLPRVVRDAAGNESIGVRSVCYLSMTYDHRLVDGADAGRFLTTVRHRLEAADFAAELDLC